jgi:hypothetical protein
MVRAHPGKNQVNDVMFVASQVTMLILFDNNSTVIVVGNLVPHYGRKQIHGNGADLFILSEYS